MSERLRSEAAWAHMCAVAPIPASSGKTRRHRLNRGGNREASHALWRIGITRMGSHPETRAYVQRRTGEGLPEKEISRADLRFCPGHGVWNRQNTAVIVCNIVRGGEP